GAGILAGDCTVAPSRLTIGNGEQDGYAIPRRRKKAGDGSRGWQRIALGDGKRKTVGKYAACVKDRDRSVLQGIGVQSAAGDAVRGIPQGGGRELCRVLKVSGLHLKMVRPQIHAFRPDYSGQRSHTIRLNVTLWRQLRMDIMLTKDKPRP